jgi:PAS domain S-box-containing protein
MRPTANHSNGAGKEILRNRRSRFKRIVEAAGALVVGMNTQGQILLFNKRCEEVTGYSEKEVLGKTIFPLLIPEDERAEFMERFQRLVNGKLPTHSPQIHWITKTGEKRLMQWSNTFVTDDQGNVEEIFGIGIDITEWKKTQQALKDSETQHRYLFDSVPVGIFRTTPDGQILDVNPALVAMLGYDDKEELLKRKAYEFYVDATARKRWEALVKQQEVVRGFEVQFQRSDGQTIWIELNARAIRNEQGQVYCYEGTLEDITKRKEAEIALVAAHHRSEFLLDLMAHDLNNINQGIMLSLELIEADEQLPAHLRERVGDTLAQVERSADLIANVKRFQSLEIEPQLLGSRDLAPPFHAAVRAVERAFPNKKLFLTTNIEEGKYQISGDGFITELFFNLLHNAMKMDSNDFVKVEVQANPADDNKYLQIQVMDQGPGVPNSEKKRIFTRYQENSKEKRGSGVGLTLVQRIIQRYGGRIWVQDRVAGNHTQGANFVVLLPRGEE